MALGCGAEEKIRYHWRKNPDPPPPVPGSPPRGPKPAPPQHRRDRSDAAQPGGHRRPRRCPADPSSVEGRDPPRPFSRCQRPPPRTHGHARPSPRPSLRRYSCSQGKLADQRLRGRPHERLLRNSTKHPRAPLLPQPSHPALLHRLPLPAAPLRSLPRTQRGTDFFRGWEASAALGGVRGFRCVRDVSGVLARSRSQFPLGGLRGWWRGGRAEE